MSVLIDQLLNSSRILDGQSSGLYFHPTDVDLGALLQDVCNLHREISPDAHIAERLAPSPLIVTGDYNLLYQAFSNILSNAIKYTVDGGTIVVRSRRETDTIVIDIKDAGIGIPGADLQKVFERYHRGRNTGGIVGAGVGLYLVKIVVELHRGAVAVESVEGEGSQFTVRLPSRAAP
jgi:signal transduction histidine kinase